MTKVTGKAAEDLAHEITMEALSDIFNIISVKMGEMEEKGLSPAFGFHLGKSCGFAITASCLAYFNDKDKAKQALEIVEDFGEYMAQSVAINKGMDKSPQSKIIIQ